MPGYERERHFENRTLQLALYAISSEIVMMMH